MGYVLQKMSASTEKYITIGGVALGVLALIYLMWESSQSIQDNVAQGVGSAVEVVIIAVGLALIAMFLV